MRTHYLSSAITILRDFGFDIPLFFAGLAGGIALLTKSSTLSRLQKFFTVLSGGFTATYLTPLVGEFLNFSENTYYGLAFLLGYSGLKIVETIVIYVQDKFSVKKVAE